MSNERPPAHITSSRFVSSRSEQPAANLLEPAAAFNPVSATKDLYRSTFRESAANSLPKGPYGEFTFTPDLRVVPFLFLVLFHSENCSISAFPATIQAAAAAAAATDLELSELTAITPLDGYVDSLSH